MPPLPFRLSQVIRYFFIIGSIPSPFSMPPLPFRLFQVIRYFFIIGSIPSPFSMPPLPFRLSQVIRYFFIIGSISSPFFLCHHYLLGFLTSSSISSSLVRFHLLFLCHRYQAFSRLLFVHHRLDFISFFYATATI
ncbi:hypothetical protein CDAR_242871 [Caerostris darwini]|uniref:Uncharacterized protein n=1 Tax=Caerostris darwini TaxID=1538125 RepID=A0AAV4WC84_9ARAC|nr:hypothetical protein CDAR_242871 [Caerostris darwini]